MSEFVPVMVENEPPARRPGPGGRLQAARLERQLEVEAVAAALHVAPRLVTAMEADQFDVFDAPVYARGFVRTYARFLNLPVDEVLAAYDDLVGSPALPSLIPPASAGPLPRDYSVLKKSGLLLLALLLVGASYWWWMGRVAPPDATAAKVVTAPAPATVAPEAATAADGDPSTDVALPASESVTLGGTPDVGPGSTAAATPAATAPVPPVSKPDAPASSATPAAKPAGTPPVAATGASLPATRVPVTTAPVASPAPVPQAASVSTGPGAAKPAPLTGLPPPPLVAPVTDGPQIVLRGKKDCWVEVRAAGGARLFYGLVRPGETHTMPGPAPWFVFLGYADGVELSVAGRVVDVPASRRDGARARFGLAADGTLR